MPFLNRIKNWDWILLISAILLVLIGLISIYSSSLGKENFFNFKKQVVFFISGIFLMVVFSFLDRRFFKSNSYVILFFYFLCILLLAGLYVFAPQIRGVRSWYKLGPVFLDPIEIVKVVLIILLAKYFSMRHVEMYRFKHIIFSGAYVLIPGLLIFFQPELGSALIIFSLWVAILLISGIKVRHFLLLCFAVLLISVLSWSFFLKDYQKQRILTFLNPEEVASLSSGWNQKQAEIAIGSGGIFGKGLGKGSQTQYGFLPENQTDFIFASLAEETGIFGISVLFILFLIFIWRIIKIAVNAGNNFSRLFASGLAALFVSEIFINIGMNLGVLPIIGISLPLVSYGGAGLIMAFISLGILQSIRNETL
jgi:rod shape determining protein RodA